MMQEPGDKGKRTGRRDREMGRRRERHIAREMQMLFFSLSTDSGNRIEVSLSLLSNKESECFKSVKDTEPALSFLMNRPLILPDFRGKKKKTSSLSLSLSLSCPE